MDDLNGAVEALAALLDKLPVSQKASLDEEADLAAFRSALAAVADDANGAQFDAARGLAAKAYITRTELSAALMLAADRLAERDGLATKASLPALDHSLVRLAAALDWETSATELVRRVPHAAHYGHDLMHAREAVKAATRELAFVVDTAEEALDDAWVDKWLELGKVRKARIASAVYIGKLRAMGHFG